ncbi:hypothetical protein COLO4_20857 [Corchorus olitorius]|uniref:Uncharacterized protein n=1 Tax=Corchorus olitorius TaxID=93759 RepID=A0A1R3IWG7_9ROSI|nr:hypothetical protein COLO4_20857 [Corchorus olitorius]
MFSSFFKPSLPHKTLAAILCLTRIAATTRSSTSRRVGVKSDRKWSSKSSSSHRLCFHNPDLVLARSYKASNPLNLLLTETRTYVQISPSNHRMNLNLMYLGPLFIHCPSTEAISLRKPLCAKSPKSSLHLTKGAWRWTLTVNPSLSRKKP